MKMLFAPGALVAALFSQTAALSGEAGVMALAPSEMKWRTLSRRHLQLICC